VGRAKRADPRDAPLFERLVTSAPTSISARRGGKEAGSGTAPRKTGSAVLPAAAPAERRSGAQDGGGGISPGGSPATRASTRMTVQLESAATESVAGAVSARKIAASAGASYSTETPSGVRSLGVPVKPRRAPKSASAASRSCPDAESLSVCERVATGKAKPDRKAWTTEGVRRQAAAKARTSASWSGCAGGETKWEVTEGWYAAPRAAQTTHLHSVEWRQPGGLYDAAVPTRGCAAALPVPPRPICGAPASGLAQLQPRRGRRDSVSCSGDSAARTSGSRC
jgi:hypothetical protein